MKKTPHLPQQALSLSAQVKGEHIGRRLDQVMAELFPSYSRTCLAQWIREGYVKVDDHMEKQVRYKVQDGQSIWVEANLKPQNHWEEQAGLPLNIIYEDDTLFIINKPAGLVVHPGNGHPDGTLVNALLHHEPKLTQVPRAGLIHRLDKDTTGLLVVARTLQAHTHLTHQLQAQTIKRVYEAVVHGVVIAGGTIDASLARHPRQRTRMAVVPDNEIYNKRVSRTAITHYRVLAQYRYHSHLRLELQTGRTHQIRVHMAHIHHPIVGDPVYGRKPTAPKALNPDLRHRLNQFPRQALHAKYLTLTHPTKNTICHWEACLPKDMADLIEALAQK